MITKPDRLDSGSGSEVKFLELARNEDVFFKLGWHVVKNRAFNEMNFSIGDRNAAEETFFATSNFRDLPKENVGIDALRVKLSHLLLEHIRNELPRLRADLENALTSAQSELKKLGQSRSTIAECRAFMADLNMGCYVLCKAGLGGHYDQDYFQLSSDDTGGSSAKLPISRLRALIQFSNKNFSDDIRRRGHKYQFEERKGTDADDNGDSYNEGDNAKESVNGHDKNAHMKPIHLSVGKSLSWTKEMLRRCRGTELLGNFNPNMIAEMFWEQSERWEMLAKRHIDVVSKTCNSFVADLLTFKAPRDIKPVVW